MPNQNLLPPMKVSVGQVFQINVPSNPTTGYTNTLSTLPSCVCLVNTQYVPSHPQLMGSGGTQVYSFVATHAGEGDLQFQDIRFSNPIEVAPQTAMEKRFIIVE